MTHISRTVALGSAGALVLGLLSITSPAVADDVDVVPVRTVTGGIDGPIGIDTDAAGNLYIASQNNASIVVHAAGASGNSGTLRTISGPATGLGNVRDVALDANGFIWSVDTAGTVAVFGPGQTGNVAPVKVFGIGAAGRGIDIAPNGEVYVRKATSYEVYPPSATGSPATPSRSVSGLGDGRAIAVTADKVWTPSDAQLRAYPTSAAGAAAPSQTIVNALVGALEVNGVDTDAQGRVYATSFSAGTVKAWSGDATGDVAPLKVLGGPASGLASVTGMAILPNGDLTVARFFADAVSTFARLFPPPAPTVTRPSAARSVKVRGGVRAAKRTIRWAAPASTGGSAVTGYRIVVKKGKKTLLVRNVGGSRRSVVAKRSKLRSGTNTVRITARNAQGWGPTVTKSFRVKK